MLGIQRWWRVWRSEDGPKVYREIMSVAEEVRASNPDALRKLVRCLLWPDVFASIRGVVEAAPHQAPDRTGTLDFFNRGGDLYNGVDALLLRLRKAVDKLEREEVVDLARDIVFAGPWHKGRFSSAVSRIGRDCQGREWRQDPLNHHVELWLPWRIVIVHGGNHSIASGMLVLRRIRKMQRRL